MDRRNKPQKKKDLTTVLGDVDIHSELRHAASREVCHTAIGGQVSEFHVHDLQAAGARRHIGIAAQQDQTIRVEDQRAVLVPGVVDLVLRVGIDVTRQLEVSTHLDGLAVLVGIRSYLEGQVAHGWVNKGGKAG